MKRLAVMNEALQLNANDRPVQSVQKIQEVLTKYPQTSAAARCQLEQKQVTEGLLDRAVKLPSTANDAASAKFLSELVAELKGTGVEGVVTEATQQLATEMLTKARDATVNRDHVTKTDVERQRSEGFGGEQILQSMQRDFARKERVTRDLLRRAIRLENIAEFDRAGELYNRILADYPSTLVAIKAQERLRAIQRQQKDDSPVEEVDLKLLKMMSS